MLPERPDRGRKDFWMLVVGFWPHADTKSLGLEVIRMVVPLTGSRVLVRNIEAEHDLGLICVF